MSESVQLHLHHPAVRSLKGFAAEGCGVAQCGDTLADNSHKAALQDLLFSIHTLCDKPERRLGSGFSL